MKLKSHIVVILLILLGNSISVFAQISITFPVSRIVFQRDNSNSATFSVAGNIDTKVDKIEGRLVPFNEGQGTMTDWQAIQYSPSNGLYNGTITGKGGWYSLEVRAMLNNEVIATSSLERVGIGEVFLVAGQSNAEGQLIYPGAEIGTIEDRVSCIDSVEYFFDENILSFNFSQLSNYKKIGPYNPVPWYWARLGEKLCQKYNVPVLFYGAALGGSAISWWERSSKGEDLMKEQPIFIAVPGMPYRAIKAGLQHYISRTGVRAILWHQGESDVKTVPSTYYSSLKTVIEQSRGDVEHNLAWVVARVGNIAGQNLVINLVPNVYPGPNTDEQIPDIPNYRYIGHFANEGLNIAAQIWFESLNDNFFKSTNPKKPSLLLNISAECFNSNNENKVYLRPKEGLVNYRWNDGNTQKDKAVGGGTSYCRGQNANGFAYFTQNVYVNPYFLELPKITLTGASTFCYGDKTNFLTTNSPYFSSWNNGQKGEAIYPQKSMSYFATKFSPFGCAFSSNEISVTVNPLPQTQIKADKSLTICSNDVVTLSADKDFKSYNWSSGETTKKIEVKKEGNYSLTVKDSLGCESEEHKVFVSVKQMPTTPVIEKLGLYNIQKVAQPNEIIGDYYEWHNLNNVLSDKETSLKITTSGEYTLKSIKVYKIDNNQELKCISPSSNKITIVVNQQEIGLGIYPNPSEDGKVNVETLPIIENGKIEVYDLKGILFFEKAFETIDKKVEIDLSALPRGSYILHLRSKYFNKSVQLFLEY